MVSEKPDYLSPDFSFESEIDAGLIDELPLWSAPFGLKLLDLIDYKKSLKVLDVGFGSGFPLVELAQRLGSSSVVYGIDPWNPSHIRTGQKIKFLNLKNVVLIKSPAEKIPLGNSMFDLVVSNNGINNVQDTEAVFSELNRVCKKNACFIASVNMPGTMSEFYEKFIQVLRKNKLHGEIDKVKMHIQNKRKSLRELKGLFAGFGFKITYIYKNRFLIKYADADAFFNHSLVKIGFMESWKRIVPLSKQNKIFIEIKNLLDETVRRKGFLEMTIPYIVIKSYKR